MTRHLALSLFAAAALVAAPAAAQDPPATPAAASAPALSVYMDCQNVFCDFDFFRTDLAMVSWVRDRAVADLHLLVTSQQTGAGGNEYTVTFIGLRQFAGINDTLKWVLPPASTDFDRRNGLANLFRLGFVRYFARMPAGAKVKVTFGETARANQATQAKDRWKAWVFRIGMNGNAFGEETYKDFSNRYNVRADRVTEKWKTNFFASENKSESRQTYPTCVDAACTTTKDTTVVIVRRGYDRTFLQVRSLGDHLSTGLRASMSASRYENHKQVVRVFPALEYNFFPYKQSTRHQAKLEYNIGYGYYQYNDTTLYNKIEEGMPIQRLLVGLAFREQWGSVDVGTNATSYINDASRYRIGSYGEFSIRIVKGLQVELYASYDQVRDQFNLAKKNFSPEEILTRQFQLGSRYFYYAFFGVSYTFGSVNNSVVNPRMTSNNF